MKYHKGKELFFSWLHPADETALEKGHKKSDE